MPCSKYNRKSGAFTTSKIISPPDWLVLWCIAHLKKVAWFSALDPDGSIYTFPGALSGNRVYAARQMERVENALGDMNLSEGNCLWVTLTAHYEKNIPGVLKSWKENQAELPKFLRALRKLGFKSYIWVRESHLDGGCHTHIILKRPGKPFKFFKDKKNPHILRLLDGALREKIKSFWNGHVEIQVISSTGAGDYLSKEIGKASHIEEAVKRARGGEAKPSDQKKMFAVYASCKTGIRRWGVSRDLIKNMTNPTDEKPESEKSIVILIPRWIVKADFFEPYTQIVNIYAPEYKYLKRKFNKLKFIQEHGPETYINTPQIKTEAEENVA